MTCSSSSQPWP